ncbi:VOC family protein [Terriglobus albidus]|uniref:VOC family protein n=1 Tax=Terriglobus albidus TaxID=1592106 RepID=UPI0021DF7F79|nr:VOC family protein [Terriglobus albidus]
MSEPENPTVPICKPDQKRLGENFFQTAIPILFVDDVSRSVAYYEQSLGFNLQWNIDSQSALVTRGDCTLLLATAMHNSSPSRVWIEVDDVQDLFEEFLIAGAVIVGPPDDLESGTEMQIADLDNNFLWFAEPKPLLH